MPLLTLHIAERKEELEFDVQNIVQLGLMSNLSLLTEFISNRFFLLLGGNSFIKMSF